MSCLSGLAVSKSKSAPEDLLQGQQHDEGERGDWCCIACFLRSYSCTSSSATRPKRCVNLKRQQVSACSMTADVRQWCMAWLAMCSTSASSPESSSMSSSSSSRWNSSRAQTGRHVVWTTCASEGRDLHQGSRCQRSGAWLGWQGWQPQRGGAG